MALHLELGPLHTRPADLEEPQSPGQVLVPDAAGRGSRLTAARLDPRFQPCLTPQHWRMNQEGVDSDGREARANLMKMYVAGGFDDRQPRTGRERALRLVVSWPWVLLQLFAIVVDSAALIEPVLKNGLDELWLTAKPTVFHALKMVFLSLVYLADVVLRLYGFGPKVFFGKWWNLFDTAIVILTAANAISAVTESAGGVGPFRFLRLLRAFRVLRIVRIALFMSHTVPRCWNRMRRITGENKRRFVSLEQDFDLDLVYITPRLISMSVPAGGCLMRFYRNPLGEVVRFFETFHAGNYLIVNACPEIPYKEAAFRTGRVERFNVKDHQPPPLSEIVRFLDVVQEWMDRCRTNIAAVHCRGGKGRTGSFCCAWLLYTKEADDAQDALNFFALRRTDMAQRKMSKVQGVETPSQVRYVGYVERLLREQAAFSPTKVFEPAAPEVRLRSFRIRAPFIRESMAEKCQGQQLVLAVQDHGGESRHTAPFRLDQLHEDKVWTFDQKAVRGDICMSVYLCPTESAEANDGMSGGKRGKQKQKHLFGCTVHSLFLEGQQLIIPVAEVDQACKEPAKYDSHGSLVLEYETF